MKMNDKDLFDGGAGPFEEIDAPIPLGAPLPLDFEKYWPLIAHLELTEEQSIKLLSAIYTVLSGCVDYHFRMPTIPDIFTALLREPSESAPAPVQLPEANKSPRKPDGAKRKKRGNHE